MPALSHTPCPLHHVEAVAALRIQITRNRRQLDWHWHCYCHAMTSSPTAARCRWMIRRCCCRSRGTRAIEIDLNSLLFVGRLLRTTTAYLRHLHRHRNCRSSSCVHADQPQKMARQVRSGGRTYGEIQKRGFPAAFTPQFSEVSIRKLTADGQVFLYPMNNILSVVRRNLISSTLV